MKTLTYLEKDWEWAPILLPLLEKPEWMEQVIVELSKILNDAITTTKDTETRKKLQNAYMQLHKFKEVETKDNQENQREASELLSLMD